MFYKTDGYQKSLKHVLSVYVPEIKKKNCKVSCIKAEYGTNTNLLFDALWPYIAQTYNLLVNIVPYSTQTKF